jgi:hypothetical protein
MKLREHHLLRQPIIEMLRSGDHPSWEIEDELARQFKVTDAERALIQYGTCTVWRNDVAFGLKMLVESRTIGCIAKRRAPNGGTRGVYRLFRKEPEFPS